MWIRSDFGLRCRRCRRHWALGPGGGRKRTAWPGWAGGGGFSPAPAVVAGPPPRLSLASYKLLHTSYHTASSTGRPVFDDLYDQDPVIGSDGFDMFGGCEARQDADLGAPTSD
jgi:hypothetical protein